MSSLLSVSGLASGLDTDNIIDGLVSIEHEKVTRLETKKSNDELTLSAWGTLSSNLSTLESKAEALKDPDSFDKFAITSSDDEIVTIKGEDGGTPGSFSVAVYQLAKSEKIMSNTYSASHTALAISGSFTVNRTQAAVEDDPTGTDVSIEIESGDSLKEIRDKINSATDIGISATIIKISDSEYALSLTSKDSGSAGAAYTETAGNVLQSLGILNASGEKGIVAHKVQSDANTVGGMEITADTLLSDIDGAGLVKNDTITIQGTDRNGSSLNAKTFVIDDPATMTVSDLMSSIENAFNGMVTASVENGRIMVADKNGGASSLQVFLTANNEGGGSLDFGGLMAVNTAGKDGILQPGTDAFFSVDGLNLTSSDNEADDSVEGVVIQLHKADLDETVQVTIDRDLDAIQANVQGFLDAFNSVIKYITEKSKVTVTEKEDDGSDSSSKDTVSKAALSGDSTTDRLKNQLRSLLTANFSHLTGNKYTNLASLGITVDQYSGEYSIDEDKFQKALETDYEGVKSLFVQRGVSDNSSFIVGRSTSDTVSGRYLVNVDNKTVSLLDKNDNIVKTFVAQLSGSVLTVKADGEAKGLSLTVPESGSAIVSFTNGVGMDIANYLDKATDTYDGFVTQRKKSIQDDMDELDDRIAEQEEKEEAYRQKLVTEYSNLEKVMSTMQTQMSNMVSQLG